MKLLIILGIIVAIVGIISAIYFLRPLKKNKVIDGGKKVKSAKFVGKAHKVMGSAVVVRKGKNLYLQLKNFHTIRGPDLRLVMSADLKAKDKVDLGDLQATSGNYYVKLPKNINLKKYSKVLIWCRAFRVLFSYAELKNVK